MADIDDSLERIKGIHGEVKLYKDDPALPVYRWGLEKGMYTDDEAEIIIKGHISSIRGLDLPTFHAGVSWRVDVAWGPRKRERRRNANPSPRSRF